MPDCYFHPGTETNVRCADCDRYICPRDMVETPVGIKCRECALPPRSMRPRGKPIQYLGAAGAALAAGVVGGLLLGQLLAAVPVVRFLSLWVGIAFGAGIGEATRRGAQGNRGPLFAAIAGAGAFIGTVATGISGAMVGGGGLGLLGSLFVIGAAVVYVLSGRW
jgi:hypothetical protein